MNVYDAPVMPAMLGVVTLSVNVYDAPVRLATLGVAGGRRS